MNEMIESELQRIREQGKGTVSERLIEDLCMCVGILNNRNIDLNTRLTKVEEQLKKKP